MILQYIDTVLLVIGLITSSLILQAFAPQFALSAFYGKPVEDQYTLFLARSAGIPIAMIGMLLVWASFDEIVRTPIVVAAVIGKGLFLATIFSNWQVTGKGYAFTVVVDGLSIMLLSLYLLSL